MRIPLILLLLLLSFFSIGQGRIGLDISSRFDGANLTLNYHYLFKNKFLVSAGLNFGGNGLQFFESVNQDAEKEAELNSPFPRVNEPYQDSSGTYPLLLAYRTNASSVLFTLGIGKMKSLNEKHTLRGHIFGRIGKGTSNLQSKYGSTQIAENRNRISINSYLTAALSMEIFHAFKLSDRMALYWGIKVPYYFQVNPSKYNSDNYRDLHNGFEPELSLGFTIYVGKGKPEKEAVN